MHLSYYAPHPPYTPPACYLDMYKDLKITDEKEDNWSHCGDDFPTFNAFHGKLTKKQKRDLAAGYYASITHIDHQIGRLLRLMRDEGVINNTVILFTSDHGEMLADHDMFRKYFAYEGSSHIPFIIADFGDNLKLPKGKCCHDIVELRDVFATLAGINDIENISEGENLVEKVLKNEKVREYLHGEHTDMETGTSSIQFIVDENYKYIWNSKTGSEQLFDMQTDRTENTDLSIDSNHSKILEKYRMILTAELNDREEGYSDGKQLIENKTPKTILAK